MSKFATVSVPVKGTDILFTVKSAAAAKKVKRLVEAMSLPHIGDITVASHTVEFEDVSDVLQKVFASAMSDDS